MPPRFARIVDISNSALRQSASMFPESADDLIRARELTNRLASSKLQEINRRIEQKIPLSRSNLAKAPYLLEPEVYYRQDYLPDKTAKNVLAPPTFSPSGHLLPPRPPLLPKGGYVDFIGFGKVPMGDWDWSDATYHRPEQVTIRHLGDVYDRLIGFTTDNPNSKWQTYLTPGGVRAFEVANQLRPRDFENFGYFDVLKVDPDYQRIALDNRKFKDIPALNLIDPEHVWNARISSKPGRAEDFVAFPLGTVGNAPTNPYNRRLLDTYHDLPIMRSMVNDGMEPGKLPSKALELLSYHLSTIPKSYADNIQQRMESMGVIPK